MTAEAAGGAADGVPDELLVGAAQHVIVGYLFPEDRAQFRTEYEAALDEARHNYDLHRVLRVVEHWRRIAALQADPAGFRSSVHAVATLVTGEPVPAGEPLALTRRKAGL